MWFVVGMTKPSQVNYAGHEDNNVFADVFDNYLQTDRLYCTFVLHKRLEINDLYIKG